jgi:hypothetical protein
MLESLPKHDNNDCIKLLRTTWYALYGGVTESLSLLKRSFEVVSLSSAIGDKLLDH